MDELTRQQALGRVILRSVILEMPVNEWTPGALQVRQDLLEEYWSGFQANHIALISAGLEQDQERQRDEIHDQVEDGYIQAQSRICDISMRLEPPRRESTPMT